MMPEGLSGAEGWETVSSAGPNDQEIDGRFYGKQPELKSVHVETIAPAFSAESHIVDLAHVKYHRDCIFTRQNNTLLIFIP